MLIFLLPFVAELSRLTAATMSNRFVIGGLFPVHEKPQLHKHRGQQCGKMSERRGIQRVEAMLYAIDMVNRNPKILPNIRLAASIVDTCANPTFALNQSLLFVRDLMGTMDVTNYHCPNNTQPRLLRAPQPVAGIIGATLSDVTIQTANLLNLFKIVQISPASTSTALDNRMKFEYFARTVSPDSFQARALADIASSFNWTWVSLVYSAGEYGEGGAEEFKKAARHHNICVALEGKITANEELLSLVANLKTAAEKDRLAQVGATVIVLFTTNVDTRRLLKAIKKVSDMQIWPDPNVLWLAADGWEMTRATTADVERIAVGTLTMTLKSARIPDFEKYFKSLHPSTYVDMESRNPWFQEFWESKFNCSLRQETLQKFQRRKCDLPNQSLSDTENFDEKVEFVIDAVQAIAHALHRMWLEVCHPKHTPTASQPICAAMNTYDRDLFGKTLYNTYLLNVSFTETAMVQARKLLGPDYFFNTFNNQFEPLPLAQPRPNTLSSHPICTRMIKALRGPQLYRQLLGVKFTGSSGNRFKFDSHGNGPAKYLIKNFQWRQSDHNYTYATVGSWEPGSLRLNHSQISWGWADTTPMSRCSAECPPLQVKKLQAGDLCCWLCVECRPNEYILDENTCEACKQGFWPEPDKYGCYNQAERSLQYLEWSSAYSVVPSVLAAIGIIFTLFVTVVFAINNDTPVVKASGRELTYLLLFGLLICYSMTYVVLLKPTQVSCGVKRLGVGLGFAILYAALLTKTNRIFRIFNSARHGAQRPRWISPVSQMLIAGLLVSVQLIGGIIWVIADPPTTRLFYPDPQPNVVLKCRLEEHWFLLSLAYDGILIVICTVYAIKTRMVPENFNETKFIGFTMYTTCIIWLAFVPIYFGTGNNFKIQTTTLCISITLSATVALLCLYSPKIYIIFMEPDKNVRKAGGSKFLKSQTPKTQDTILSNNHASYAPLSQKPPQREELQPMLKNSVKDVDQISKDLVIPAVPVVLPTELLQDDDDFHSSRDSLDSF